MALDLGSPRLGAESLGGILDQELLDKVAAAAGHGVVLGELDLVLQDVGKGLVASGALERCDSKDHLVDEDAESPPVDG